MVESRPGSWPSPRSIIVKVGYSFLPSAVMIISECCLRSFSKSSSVPINLTIASCKDFGALLLSVGSMPRSRHFFINIASIEFVIFSTKAFSGYFICPSTRPALTSSVTFLPPIWTHSTFLKNSLSASIESTASAVVASSNLFKISMLSFVFIVKV